MDKDQLIKIQEQIKNARMKHTEALKDIADMERAGLTEQATSAKSKLKEANDKLTKLESVYMMQKV